MDLRAEGYQGLSFRNSPNMGTAVAAGKSRAPSSYIQCPKAQASATTAHRPVANPDHRSGWKGGGGRGSTSWPRSSPTGGLSGRRAREGRLRVRPTRNEEEWPRKRIIRTTRKLYIGANWRSPHATAPTTMPIHETSGDHHARIGNRCHSARPDVDRAAEEAATAWFQDFRPGRKGRPGSRSHSRRNPAILTEDPALGPRRSSNGGDWARRSPCRAESQDGSRLRLTRETASIAGARSPEETLGACQPATTLLRRAESVTLPHHAPWNSADQPDRAQWYLARTLRRGAPHPEPVGNKHASSQAAIYSRGSARGGGSRPAPSRSFTATRPRGDCTPPGAAPAARHRSPSAVPTRGFRVTKAAADTVKRSDARTRRASPRTSSSPIAAPTSRRGCAPRSPNAFSIPASPATRPPG